MSVRSNRLFVSVIVLASLAAPVLRSQNTMRDSAGIRIVETSAANVQRWPLSPAPERSIGSLDGAIPYQFSRILDALRLGDGRIVVIDANLDLRYFSPDGRHLTTFGRSGDGPGEFRRITDVFRLAGDSLLVYDAASARLTTVTPGGTLARSINTQGYPGLSSARDIVGLLSNGRLAIARREPYPMGAPTGYYREWVTVAATAPGAARSDTAIRLPSTEWYIFAANPPDPNRSGPGYKHPFGYESAAVTWNGRIVTGTTDRYELRVFDSNAALRTIIRRTDAPRAPLARARIDEYIRAVAAVDGAASAAEHRGQLAWFPGPRYVPAFSQVLADDVGCLWVRDFQAPDPPRDRRESAWVVYGGDGRAIARVSMPPGFTPLSISAQHIVGRVRDSLDVQYIRVYRLNRS